MNKELQAAIVNDIAKKDDTELEKMSDNMNYFVDQMTEGELEVAIDAGKTFMKMTRSIRADHYYKTKDYILSDSNDVSKYCPRSMNFMFEQVAAIDASIIEAMETRLRELRPTK